MQTEWEIGRERERGSGCTERPTCTTSPRTWTRRLNKRCFVRALCTLRTERERQPIRCKYALVSLAKLLTELTSYRLHNTNQTHRQRPSSHDPAKSGWMRCPQNMLFCCWLNSLNPSDRRLSKQCDTEIRKIVVDVVVVLGKEQINRERCHLRGCGNVFFAGFCCASIATVVTVKMGVYDVRDAVNIDEQQRCTNVCVCRLVVWNSRDRDKALQTKTL